jgi:hypothetical protein
LVEHDPFLPGSDREFESRFPLQSLLEVPFPTSFFTPVVQLP